MPERKKWVRKGGSEEQESPGETNYTQIIAKKLVQTTIAEVSEDDEDDRGSSRTKVPLPPDLSPLRKK